MRCNMPLVKLKKAFGRTGFQYQVKTTAYCVEAVVMLCEIRNLEIIKEAKSIGTYIQYTKNERI